MSDLAATNCGCNGCNNCGGNSNSCCSIIIWILLLSVFCGNQGGMTWGMGGNCGCNECGNQSWIWIILILLFCGCGNQNGCGCGF